MSDELGEKITAQLIGWWLGGGNETAGEVADRILALVSMDRAALVEAVRNITHPNEGPCPVCGHIFDAHRDGCPYDAIDLAIDATFASAEVGDGWVSVKDRLPENKDYVFVAEKYEDTPFVGWWSGKEWIVDQSHLRCEGDGRIEDYVAQSCITHWRPLPESPKEVGHD